MNLDLEFVLLTETQQIPKCFDCGQDRPDLELRDFLIEQAFTFHHERIASTVVVINATKGCVVAYYSLLNDNLHLAGLRKSLMENGISADQVERLLSRISDNKQHLHFPAVKIARLAVANAFQGQGLGKTILKRIMGQFFDQHYPAVRFLTVDAVNRERTINFYRQMGFNFILMPYKKRQTIPMCFDLKA